MSAYKIITDSGSDLSPALIEQLNIVSVPLTVLFRG